MCSFGEETKSAFLRDFPAFLFGARRQPDRSGLQSTEMLRLENLVVLCLTLTAVINNAQADTKKAKKGVTDKKVDAGRATKPDGQFVDVNANVILPDMVRRAKGFSPQSFLLMHDLIKRVETKAMKKYWQLHKGSLKLPVTSKTSSKKSTSKKGPKTEHQKSNTKL